MNNGNSGQRNPWSSYGNDQSQHQQYEQSEQENQFQPQENQLGTGQNLPVNQFVTPTFLQDQYDNRSGIRRTTAPNTPQQQTRTSSRTSVQSQVRQSSQRQVNQLETTAVGHAIRKQDGSIIIEVGTHLEYLQKLNTGMVKLVAILDPNSQYQAEEKEIETEKHLSALFRAVKVGDFKEDKEEKEIGEGGVKVKPVERKSHYQYHSKVFTLIRIPARGGSDWNQFRSRNSDDILHQYSGNKPGRSTPEGDEDTILGLLMAQEEIFSNSQGVSLKNCPISVYRIKNYEKLRRSALGGAGSIVIALILAIPAFLIYRYRLLQRLVGRFHKSSPGDKNAS